MAVLSTAFRLQVPRRLYEEMIAQAVAELPNECCGLLAGTPEGRVTHRYALVNAAASPVEYLSEPRSMFEAVRAMRSHGIDIVAVYHSHPSSEALPSRTDKERTYSPEIVNLIISLKSDVSDVRGWLLNESDAREVEWDIVD
jgi:proteasome lid subunit RPN8/RPN11